MVLVPELSRSEKERHVELIKEFVYSQLSTSDCDIEFYDNGAEKGIYKVETARGNYLAAAASRDKSKKLLGEYNLLHHLHEKDEELFPRPVSHYKSTEDLGDLILMEFVDRPSIYRLKSQSQTPPNFGKDLARHVGYAAIRAVENTGHYSSEPHDGNILVQMAGDSIEEVSFCDAIQFRDGSIADAISSIMTYGEERSECLRFTPQFAKGIEQALSESRNIPEVATKDLYLPELRKYSGIV